VEDILPELLSSPFRNYADVPVRGELVEPRTESSPFDRLRANGFESAFTKRCTKRAAATGALLQQGRLKAMGWCKAGTAETEASVGSRILVVDDLPQNLELVEAHLGMLGHTVATASNGVDALRMMKENAADLILLDVMMPGLDGYEVCRRLKADGATAFIPVLILTALSVAEEIGRAMEAGADDFLQKPFSRLELLIRVRSLLRIKKLRDQLENYRRMATVGEMVSGIANEMRNPLAITSSAAQILLRKGADPTLRQECAEKIRTAVNRVAAIVENFLRFNHPSNGVVEPLDVSPPTTSPVSNLDGLKALSIQA